MDKNTIRENEIHPDKEIMEKFTNDILHFGQLQELEVHNFESVMLLRCHIKNLPDGETYESDDPILPIIMNFNDETCTFFSFCLVNPKTFKKDINKSVNYINEILEYGKLYIDPDGDVNWKSSISLKSYTIEDIGVHLKSLLTAMIKLILIEMDLINLDDTDTSGEVNQ